MWTVVNLALEQGLVYGPVILGVAISFRLLDFPDLTVDGSFTLGAAVTAVLLVQGQRPWVCVVAGMAAGAVAGMVTAQLNARLRINKILAGILVMSVLYSVNLRVMDKPNISLLTATTLLTPLESSRLPDDWAIILFCGGVTVVLATILTAFLHTELGMLVRATGSNEQVVQSLGVSTGITKTVGMALANGAVALAGSLVAQSQGFADVGMGIGMIIAGLASLLIGEALFRPRRVITLLLAALVGSVVYQGIVSTGLRVGLAPTDLKLATGVMVIVAMTVASRRQESYA